jgi:rRNA maturation endonuclease Nob1
MSNEQPTLILPPPPPKTLCPICGKATYSKGGIHPQCAMQQADEPRLIRLRTRKAADSKAKKPVRQTWKKRCPKCGTHVHARREACECGHRFRDR